MNKNILILFVLFFFNSYFQTYSQNKELKKIIYKTIAHNKDEFKDQSIIYFEIPQFLKTTSSNETYSYNKKKNITICIINEREVFDSEKIKFYYKILFAKEKTNLIQVFKVIHPSVGMGRTLINELNY